jgi:hypothetical protein
MALLKRHPRPHGTRIPHVHHGAAGSSGGLFSPISRRADGEVAVADNQLLAAQYFQRFPKERYHTEVESWRELQSQNIEFTMKRLREPIESAG